jgi:hypothetical protein
MASAATRRRNDKRTRGDRESKSHEVIHKEIGTRRRFSAITLDVQSYYTRVFHHVHPIKTGT